MIWFTKNRESSRVYQDCSLSIQVLICVFWFDPGTRAGVHRRCVTVSRAKCLEELTPGLIARQTTDLVLGWRSLDGVRCQVVR